MSESATAPAAVNGVADAAPTLPPLYRQLEGLTAERHRALRLRDAGYGFAAAASAVPLAAEEFTIAARSLAIVFAAQAPHMPVALTGLTSGTNLFVDAGGAWKIGAYVPAYLRRYPFFLLRVAQDSDELALCIDPGAPQVSDSAGEPLFTADGKPAPQLERAFAFTKSVEEAMLRTRTMTQRLAEFGLLKSSVVQFEQHGKPVRIDGFFAVDRPTLAALPPEQHGKPVRIDGFFAVDRPTLAALPPEQLAELRDNGWLEVIYAHLLSIGGIPDLARDISA